jgi:replicative DNA helicase
MAAESMRTPRQDPITEVARAACEAVREVGTDVVRNLREIGLFELPVGGHGPLPFDLEAEYAVLEALLMGRRLVSELPCEAGHFYVPFHVGVVAVVAALEEVVRDDDDEGADEDDDEGEDGVDLALVGSVLAKQGIDRHRAMRGLLALRDDAPMRVDVDELAERIREFGERRRAIALMGRVEQAWRSGLDAPTADVAAVRQALSRWSDA